MADEANSPVERLYNGIIKEKSYLCHDDWYVSDTGGNHFRHQRNRYGPDDSGDSGAVEYDDFHAPENDSGWSAYAAYIGVVASFVTIVQLLLQGYLPSLYDSLGIYIPLIVVNCIILGRAEAYAGKNPVIPSLFDGIGMGLGFTIGLTSIGAVRELIGAGQLFGFQILPESYEPVTIFIMAPGAFLVLAMLLRFRTM